MANRKLIGTTELKKRGTLKWNTEMDVTPEAPLVYSNMVGVVASDNEVCLEFALTCPPFNIEEINGKATIYSPVVTRVLMPYAAAKQLIGALSEHVARMDDKAKTAEK